MPATPRIPTLFGSLIPDPWDWPRFHAAVRKACDRPLLLVPADLPSDRASLWVATTDVDPIVYSHGTDQARRLHGIAHQMAHVLLGHQVSTSGADPSMFAHLDPTLIASVLTVSRFAPADERAADDFASLVVARALPAAQPEGQQ